MESSIPEKSAWRVFCNQETLDKCRQDKKFSYIVALARANNALHTSYFLRHSAPGELTPSSRRIKLNAIFLSSCFMYEALKLIQKMNRTFKDDELFQNGLRQLLKNPVARRIERMVNPARNQGIFHFDPDEFEQAIKELRVDPCIFVEGRSPEGYRYHYADMLVGFMIFGVSPEAPEFQSIVNDFSEIAVLFQEFEKESNKLIEKYLNEWNFNKISTVIGSGFVDPLPSY